MPTVPTIPGTTQVNTPDAGVKLDYGALNAPNRAKQVLAGAIGDVGEKLNQFSQKLQATVNYGIAADADRQMRQATADFQASRAGRNDPDNWAGEWKETASKTWEKINDTHAMGPALKRNLTQNYLDWQQSNGVEVNMLANKKRIGLAVDHATGLVDEAAKDGHVDAIASAYDPLVKLGAITPDHAKLLIQEGMQKSDRYAADRYIAANPVAGEKYLMETDAKGKYVNFQHMDDNTRVTVAFQAHRFAQMKMADVATGFFNQRQEFLNQEPGESVPDVNPSEVRQAVASGYMTPAAAKAYLKPPKPDFDPQAAADLKREIMNTDFSTDQGNLENFSFMAKIAGVAAGNKEAMSELQQTLKLKSDPKSELNSAPSKRFFAEATKAGPSMFLSPEITKAPGESYFSAIAAANSKLATAASAAAKYSADDQSDAAVASRDALKFARAAAAAANRTTPKHSHKELDNLGTPEERKAAESAYSDYLDQMTSFIKQKADSGKPATALEINDYSAELRKPYVMAAAAHAVTSPVISRPNVTEEEYKAMKPGETFYWNGQAKIKAKK